MDKKEGINTNLTKNNSTIVFGILGIIFSFISAGIAIILAIIGLVLGVLDYKINKKTATWGIVLSIVAILFVIGSQSNNNNSVNSSSDNNQTINTPISETQTQNPSPTATPSGPLTSFGDGTFIVGKDIEPGTYSNGSGSQGCYYARLSGFGGTNGEIIANNNTDSSAIITIASTDKGFQSTNCGTWTQIQAPAPASIKSVTTAVTPTPIDWTTYENIPSDFLKNPPYYIGTKVKLSAAVIDFLAAGDRGGTTNYISVIGTDQAVAGQQLMFEIDSSANYQKAVSSVNKGDEITVYGTVEKSNSFTNANGGTVVVPVINIARLDECSGYETCTSVTQTVFPAGITQSSAQTSSTVNSNLPPLTAYKGKLNTMLPGIQFFIGTPTVYAALAGTYTQPSTGDQYVVEYVQITDQSSSLQVNYYPSDFTLVDPNSGSQYNETFMVTSDPVFQSGTLNPGGTVSGNIVYEVPDTISASQFNIHYDEYIGGTHVVTDFK